MASGEDPENYPKCAVGFRLPLVNEDEWNLGLRAALYLLAMLYLFLGGAVVMDYSLASASIITSRVKTIYLSKPTNPSRGEPGLDVVTVRVWHDTIANLCVMAVTTSSFEILLCTLEIIENNFDHGELGPGVIVGSAVFNILVTTSLCTVSVPRNEIRKIEKLQVYVVSMVFALVAYCWIIVVLYHSTPAVITLWEAIITVLMFPIFILMVYLGHKNFWWHCASKIFHFKQPKIARLRSVDEKSLLKEDLLEDNIDREKLAALVHRLKRHSGLTHHDAATVAAFKLLHDQPHSVLWYRLEAIRSLTAGYRYMEGLDTRLQQTYRYIADDDGSESYDGASTFRSTMESYSHHSHTTLSRFRPSAGSASIATVLYDPHLSIIEFHSAIVAVDRNVGNSEVTICRYGNLDILAKVRLTSIDGTAKKNQDYLPIDQILVFKPGQPDVFAQVILINASGWDEDKEFFLRLSLIHNEHENVALSKLYLMAVTIIDGESQSIITFENRGLIVKESSEMVMIMVNRHDGAAGSVSVRWKTLDQTAVSGRDYIGGSGELVFNPGEMSLHLEIPIVNHMSDEKDVCFVVELFAPKGGARLGRINRCAVTITNDDDLQSFIGTMESVTSANLDAIRVKKSTWTQQIRDAMLVDGGKVAQAKRIDYVAHFVSFLWKVLFSLLPPPTLLGGWPCFVISFITMGGMVMLISDAAGTFGCLIRFDPTVTALSFVTIAASFPEVLVARRQTRMERTADVCLIGMAGRISANMMLGLGIPWVIAVVYHHVQGTSFIIRDPDVGQNVVLFVVFALAAQSIMVVRRFTPFCGQAEFGGPRIWVWMTFIVLISLWIAYLSCSHYLMHGHISPIE